MQDKVDARIQKTKDKLRKALLDILLEKKLSEVTVSEICTKAGVNRNTFYSHYRTIDDLLKSIETEFLGEIVRRLKETVEPDGDLMVLLDTLLTAVKENSDMCKVLFSDNGNPNYLSSIVDFCLPVAQEGWTAFSGISEKDGRILYNFISGGAVAVIKDWVLSGFKESQDAIVWRLSVFCQGIIGNFETSARSAP